MPACRSCRAPVEFVPTQRGKLMPVDSDGVSHFARCPDAPRFRKPALPEDECHACKGRDLERLPGTGPHHGAVKCRSCGVRRWLRKPATAGQ